MCFLGSCCRFCKPLLPGLLADPFESLVVGLVRVVVDRVVCSVDVSLVVISAEHHFQSVLFRQLAVRAVKDVMLFQVAFEAVIVPPVLTDVAAAGSLVLNDGFHSFFISLLPCLVSDEVVLLCTRDI